MAKIKSEALVGDMHEKIEDVIQNLQDALDSNEYTIVHDAVVQATIDLGTLIEDEEDDGKDN